MKVCCFYSDLGYGSNSNYRKMLDRWTVSFSDNGFTPAILGLSDAAAHPRFHEISEIVSKLPTVNGRGYEDACWVRWLAYELAAPALFTDFDVINYGLKPEDVPHGDLISLAETPNPGAFFATPEGIRNFIAHIHMAEEFSIELYGKPHTSDLCLFCGMNYPTVQHCYDYGREGYLTSKLVHFCNVAVKPEHRQQYRWMAMDELTERRKQ